MKTKAKTKTDPRRSSAETPKQTTARVKRFWFHDLDVALGRLPRVPLSNTKITDAGTKPANLT